MTIAALKRVMPKAYAFGLGVFVLGSPSIRKIGPLPVQKDDGWGSAEYFSRALPEASSRLFFLCEADVGKTLCHVGGLVPEAEGDGKGRKPMPSLGRTKRSHLPMQRVERRHSGVPLRRAGN
ncbi:MAG: hypothetical protein RML74_09930 [Acidobacteriota bacterium]|nr:hypothetical protein [Blastocatellia bacterium]MDW8168778.1 hypothetical protein [Acidobacteriota bacterium]MDW8255682.1 hypothetical protein [Acidobacteriota bacterium]